MPNWLIMLIISRRAERPWSEILKCPLHPSDCLSIRHVSFSHCNSKTHCCVSSKFCRYLHHVMGMCCRLRNGQGHHSLEGPGRGWNPYPGVPPTTGLLVLGRPQSKDSYLMIDMGTFLLDLRPEVGYTFAPFGSSCVWEEPYCLLTGSK